MEEVTATTAETTETTTNTTTTKTTRMMPRKEFEHMRSNSLPNIFHSSLFTARASNGKRSSLQQTPLETGSDIFTDRMGMIDLNYHDTQKIVRDLLEHHTSSLATLNERMSEEALEDSHAFSDVKKKGRSSLSEASNSQMKSLEPLPEYDNDDDEEEEEDEVRHEILSPTSLLVPKKRPNHPALARLKKEAISMPNIYGIRVSTGGSTSGSYDFDLPDNGDLLTDHKGICDLEYSEMKKIVDEVLHPSDDDDNSAPSSPTAVARRSTRSSINEITGGSGDFIIPEEDEDEDEEEETTADTNPSTTTPATSTPSKRMMPRKALEHMRSNSLPNVFHSSTFTKKPSSLRQTPLKADDILTDRLGMIDLNYEDTQKVVRDLLEHHTSSLGTLNERMSEEALDDSHAFTDVPKKGRSSLSDLSSSQLQSLEPLQEGEEEEEGEAPPLPKDDPLLSPTSRLFPKKKKRALLQAKGALSMPNIYGGGSKDKDLLTDHKGICDLEYSDMKKIVQEVLHHDTMSPKNNPTTATRSSTRSSINEITGDSTDFAIPEEEEEVEDRKEETTPSTTATIEEEETEAQRESTSVTKPKKKGFFQKLKARASKKKTLGNP